MRTHARLAIALCMIAFIKGVQAEGCDPECDQPTDWMKFTSIDMKVSAKHPAWSAKWHAEFDHSTFDLRIDMDGELGGKPQKGAIAMVAGRVMLSKGLDLQPGYEIDYLDAPMLYTKLALIVLGRALPRGAVSFDKEYAIRIREPRNDIRFATPSAEGHLTAPWSADGSLTKLASGAVRYRIHLKGGTQNPFGQAQEPMDLEMSGELAMLARPVLDEAMRLDGWKTYGVGPQVEKNGGSTKYDYGAKPDAATPFKTIADIRAYIRAENDPGQKDDTKDFTGFWKKDCEDAWGVQIKHYGNDGKYSIVFCGPGGCGDPADGRLTFITGDKRFEVVSEDELIEIRRSGDREREIRCTRETNPKLEYRTRPPQ